ncbi:hypothetical protein C7I84_06000 [Mesorhizobium ephedrae]|uniref:Uncharacterized protein n=1 Tax=Kumtagia ephedrae TaxID=2116701 RepID=A0A2P7SPR0_9HYPH|nr:hypothetical protein C7I84_06000 [Mesorhizobium ephedrae]
MKARGMRPATVKCRLDSWFVGRPIPSVKIKWVPNRPEVGWMLSVGDTVYIGERALRAKRVGARKVSSSFFSTLYNRTGICTIWYVDLP